MQARLGLPNKQKDGVLVGTLISGASTESARLQAIVAQGGSLKGACRRHTAKSGATVIGLSRLVRPELADSVLSRRGVLSLWLIGASHSPLFEGHHNLPLLFNFQNGPTFPRTGKHSYATCHRPLAPDLRSLPCHAQPATYLATEDRIFTIRPSFLLAWLINPGRQAAKIP